MKAFKLFIISIVILVFSSVLPLVSNVCVLEKVYLHEKPGIGEHLVLYFSSNPKYSYLSKNEKRSLFDQETKLRFKDVLIKSQSCKKEIERINSLSKDHSRKISHASKYKNLDISFRYNPNKKGFAHDTFRSIRNKSGFVFHAWNSSFDGKAFAESLVPSLKGKVAVVDFGHGGLDSGAISHYGRREKDIVRGIGTKLVKMLKKNGYGVCLTRKADEFVSLDKRTRLANTCKDANLFVSIHASSAGSDKYSGIETYFMDSSLFEKKLTFAQGKKISDFYDTVVDKKHRSSVLADCIHGNIVEAAQKYDNKIHDRSVKKKVSQVLLGAKMPSALVEVGFLSNKREEGLLANGKYQDKLARGIFNGIEQYISNIKVA